MDGRHRVWRFERCLIAATAHGDHQVHYVKAKHGEGFPQKEASVDDGAKDQDDSSQVEEQIPTEIGTHQHLV